ncbi:MAG: hypothetical protein H7Y20_14725 [Bryobacteraceae bacterium]|nr:hypothetical protein [Bryobacteraceae bacterium]
MITAIKIELVSGLPDNDNGKIFFLDGNATAYQGTVATDLNPGIYKLTANKPKKLWIIHGASGQLRFSVSLDGPDPWSLPYSPGLRLEVVGSSFVGNQNEEMLDGIGADAYAEDPDYIDRVTGGHYDVLMDVFTVDYADGTSLELDFESILSQVENPGTTNMFVYYRNLQNNKIYPRIFNSRTTPNLASMVLETQAALPGAKALGKIGRFLIELIIERGQRGPAGSPKSGGNWRTRPTGSAGAVRKFLGISGNPPAARIGAQGDPDHLISGVQLVGKQVVYRVDSISAIGKDAATVRAAHRAMLVSAAQTAQRLGLKEFTLLGKQSGPNFVRHADQLARAVGKSGSGKAATGGVGFPDYEVILHVSPILSTNAP